MFRLFVFTFVVTANALDGDTDAATSTSTIVVIACLALAVLGLLVFVVDVRRVNARVYERQLQCVELPARTRAHIVVVEGNIAAGKSTFISLVGSALQRRGVRVRTLVEPIAEWCDVGTAHIDLLAASYNDPTTNAFPFQVTALLTHARSVRRALKNAQVDDVLLVERWAFSYRHVFVRAAFERKYINAAQLAVYEMLCDELAECIGVRPDCVLYLNASAELCAMRRMHRGRACETSVDIEHLSRLNEYYKQLFVDGGGAHVCSQLTQIDVAGDLADLLSSPRLADEWATRLIDKLALSSSQQ